MPSSKIVPCGRGRYQFGGFHHHDDDRARCGDDHHLFELAHLLTRQVRHCIQSAITTISAEGASWKKG